MRLRSGIAQPGPLGIVLLAALLGGCAPRYYALPPFEGITEVEIGHESSRPVRITDRKRVTAIVAFLNERRDRWLDPGDHVFSVPSELNIIGAHGHRVASVFVGAGGMSQMRPDVMTMFEGRLQERYLSRAPSPTEAENDATMLCRILGAKYAPIVCSY